MILPREAEQLDPRFIVDPYGLKVSRLLFGSLVTIDPRSLEVVPDLAQRVEVLGDTEYLVTLREGLRFSDGSVLDARDVVATFKGIVDPALESPYARTYARIAHVEAEGRHRVRFRLAAPHATFVTDLEVPIVRAEDARTPIADLGGPPPIGAGPYRLVERTTGELVVEANPHWHRGEVLHERIRFVVIRDGNTRALRMQAGGGDVALQAIDPLLLPLFARDPRFELRSAPGVGTSYIGFHTEAPPLSDRRVRHAIAHAIDRELLIRTELAGHARPTASWVPLGHWAAQEGLPRYGYDPSRSRVLLEEAGVQGLSLLLRTSNDRARLSIARAIAAMLAKVGIEVQVRPSETATLIQDLNAGRFELTLLQVPEVFEPHVLSWFFASERIPEDGRSGANRWRIRDRGLDEALERGRRNPQRALRVAAYADAQRILAEALPVFPLWQEENVAVVRRGVTFEVPRDGRFATLAR